MAATTSRDTVPNIGFDDQICFALYSASRSVTSHYRHLLEPLGLTYPQYLVMLLLWEDGPSSVGQLGARLHLDSGTLSPLLKRLEAAEFIERRRAVDDERQVEITLTPAGRDLRRKTRKIPALICQATGMTPEQLTRLTRTLHELSDSVRLSAD